MVALSCECVRFHSCTLALCALLQAIVDGTITSADLATSITIQSLTVTASFTIPGGIAYGATTDASSCSVGGTFLSNGGAAVMKRLYVGSGTFLQSSIDASSSSLGGALTVSGGAAIASKVFIGGSTFLDATFDSSSSSQGGTLQVAGGASFAKRVYVGNTLTLSVATDASTSSVGGSLTAAGGASFGMFFHTGLFALSHTLVLCWPCVRCLCVEMGFCRLLLVWSWVCGLRLLYLVCGMIAGGRLFVGGSFDASSSSTGGTLIVSGGASIAKSFFVGGGVFVQSTIDASSTSVSGSLSVAGGASVARSLYVGDGVYATKTTDSASSTNGGALTVSGGASIGTSPSQFFVAHTARQQQKTIAVGQ